MQVKGSNSESTRNQGSEPDCSAARKSSAGSAGKARKRYTLRTLMGTKLEEIIAATRARVTSAKAAADVGDLSALARHHWPRGFRQRLQRVSQNGPTVIAELKKASPSKGLIRADFDVPRLASAIEQAGAAALSILTDERFFRGSLHNLALASAATQIPCLRKDFIIDPFQLLEARACRADAVLLIVAALAQDDLTALCRGARELHLDVLSEVHDAAELERALAAGCDLIGVNNRNLHTFEVNLKTSYELVKKIPASVIKVAESGLESANDISRLRDAGFDAFLIGELLMRAAQPGEALRELLAKSTATA